MEEKLVFTHIYDEYIFFFLGLQVSFFLEKFL